MAKSRGPGKTVIRRTIIEEVPGGEGPNKPNWFKQNPVASVGLGFLALILLFAPLFPSTKTVQTTETVMVPMSTEMTVPGTTTTKTIKVFVGYLVTADGWNENVDASERIVEVRKSAAQGGTYTYSLIDDSGNEVIYRNIVSNDLTKTGSANVEVSTDGGTKTGTQMVPQQVTKDKQVQVRVSFLQWLFGGN